jgi:hypothetical protein
LTGTLAFRVFPILRVFGLSVVNRAGAPASRGRLFARWAFVWIPTIVATLFAAAIATSLAKSEPLFSLTIGLSLLAALIAAMDFVILYAALRPVASIQDRLAGTRLVPR